MSYLIFKDLKPGDSLTITEKPTAGLIRNNYSDINYPYTFTINGVVHIAVSFYPHISILDTNGHRWSISDNNVHIFQRNNILIDRKSKINNLNNESDIS